MLKNNDRNVALGVLNIVAATTTACTMSLFIVNAVKNLRK